MSPVHNLPRGLYAICDDSVRAELPLQEKAALLLQGGARVLQLRQKKTLPAEALAAARRIADLCRRAGSLCIVNDRADYALMCGADGVHLGDDDLPAADVRRLLGPTKIIGVTVRDLRMARDAEAAGANYVGLGPVFATATKAVSAPPLGIKKFAAIAAGSPLPVVAISGITLENMPLLQPAGAHGAAVISDLLEAEDIPARARALNAAFAGRDR